MYGGYVSSINMDSVSNSFGQGLQMLEDNLNTMIQKIQANPSPSQSDLLMMQLVSAKFQAVVQSETGIVKSLGDMMKAVAMNVGS